MWDLLYYFFKKYKNYYLFKIFYILIYKLKIKSSPNKEMTYKL